MTDTPKPIKPGDWVAFMSDGTIVYGQVEYVNPERYTTHVEIVTTAGTRRQDSILEVRKAPDAD